MRWKPSHMAEVVGCIDNAVPEMVVPDSVHNRASCEHVLRINNPFGQRSAPAPFIEGIGKSKRGIRSRHSGYPGRVHQFSGTLHVSMRKQMHRPGSFRGQEIAAWLKIARCSVHLFWWP